MDNKDKEFASEKEYLKTVIVFLKNEISKLKDSLELRKRLLYRERREMGVIIGENRSSGLAADISQSIAEDQRQLASINMFSKLLKRDERLLFSPYFGRFDFKEDGETITEKFYIGLHNIYDADGEGDILVYDWRAPISSIYYRNELGRASYSAPDGEISGEVSLKRQYRIENSTLKYFFDSSRVITDDILQETLAHNASPKMQNIVRTIQNEQDKVIRDSTSDLLITQGVAGSGKTTIALHRIAYLLYHSAAKELSSKNIIIISLSNVFSTYISDILPQLGEENVKETTFGDIAYKLTGSTVGYKRVEFIDKLLDLEKIGTAELMKSTLLFKGSKVFLQIIDRFLRYYERRLINFSDISYGGNIIEMREALKGIFLHNKTGMPALSRLRRIETIIKSKIDVLQSNYHKQLQEKIKAMQGHQYDYKSVARLIAIKKAEAVRRQIATFTALNAFDIYRELFRDWNRFMKISKGLVLPKNIREIFENTKKALMNGAEYDDMAALCYISLLLDYPSGFDDIKHVVVDEAQDYMPVHYAIFAKLFPFASFTVLGDVEQSVETCASSEFYNEISEVLNKKRSILLTLKRSYRSSYEITNFSLKIPRKRPEITAFERHEKEPELIFCEDEKLEEKIITDVGLALKDGFETAAIICAESRQARKLYERLSKKMQITLVEKSGEVKRGILVIPAYLSKGLEFDCVFIPHLDDENFGGFFSQNLLYVACTRALHRLTIYYSKDSNILRRLKS